MRTNESCSSTPDAPINVTATGGDAYATVNFTAPVSNGGSAIIGYTAISSPGGLTEVCFVSPCVVTGLTNGVAYTFTVTATNAVGTSAASVASNSVTVNPIVIAQAYYIHADQLDTPRVITDSNGNVVWQWDNFDPFGANMANENPAEAGTFNFNLRFPGQYYDRETNLHYNINRDYDPAIGRYIESDPSGLGGGINTYIYVGGNPLSRIDPLGLYWFRQPWQTPGAVGRPDTQVPPGGPVSEFIEQHVPAGYTFGEMHDNFVDAATGAGIPDVVANIPSMIPMYVVAVATEVMRTVGILDQPTPQAQPTQCK